MYISRVYFSDKNKNYVVVIIIFENQKKKEVSNQVIIKSQNDKIHTSFLMKLIDS